MPLRWGLHNILKKNKKKKQGKCYFLETFNKYLLKKFKKNVYESDVSGIHESAEICK